MIVTTINQSHKILNQTQLIIDQSEPSMEDLEVKKQILVLKSK